MATSGRYQSKVLSFFSERSLRFRDRTSQTLRQIKVAAVWGTQILLYPVYLAFQSTRLISKQLRQVVRQALPQLQAAKQSLQILAHSADSSGKPFPILTSDTPIQNTLHAVDALIQSLSPEQIAGYLGTEAPEEPELGSSSSGMLREVVSAIVPSSPLSLASTRIRGVASELTTQKLVLVTVENHILDILTLEQEAQLQRRMIWELVTYWRQQRTVQAGPLTIGQLPALKSLLVDRFLPLPADRPNALLPIRVFHRLMAWVQTSPVAIATNVFQESQLALLHAVQSGAVGNLPAANSELRSANVSWLSLEEVFGDLFAGGRQSESTDPLQTRIQSQMQTWLQTSTTELAKLPAKATGLFQSSGVGLDSSPTSESPHSPHALPPANSAASTSPPDSLWLTAQTLFGITQSSKHASKSAGAEPVLQNYHETVKSSQTTLVKRPPSAVNPVNQEVSQVAVSETSKHLVSPLSTHPSEVEQSALTPTYIDIEADVKLVTYVKHPLEQLLEWIDRGMVWMEESLARVLTWLRGRFR